MKAADRFRDKALQSIFNGMIGRCYRTYNRSYKYYGACGITICQEWLNNHRAFEEWAYDNGYRKGLTIDRLNVNEGYCPSNCRWISRADNSKWKSNSHIIWIGIYCDTAQGWSLKVQKSKTWFNNMFKRHGYVYAYQKLLRRVEEIGGIKKVMGIPEEEPDIAHLLKDIENDYLEDVTDL